MDDCFWVVPHFVTPTGLSSADWVAQVFETVVTELFGWSLDEAKAATGSSLNLLGLRIALHQDGSEWRVDYVKASR